MALGVGHGSPGVSSQEGGEHGDFTDFAGPTGDPGSSVSPNPEQTMPSCKVSAPSESPSVPTADYSKLPKLGAAQYRAGETFMFKASLGGQPCNLLIDMGASFCFLSEQWLHKTHKGKIWGQTYPLPEPIPVLTAENSMVSTSSGFSSTLGLQQFFFKVDAKLMPSMLQGVDLILGMDWLRANDFVIDCGRDLCMFRWADQEHYLRGASFAGGHAAGGSAACAGVPLARFSSPFLSARRAKKEAKHGCPVWLVVVQNAVPGNAQSSAHESRPAAASLASCAAQGRSHSAAAMHALAASAQLPAASCLASGPHTGCAPGPRSCCAGVRAHPASPAGSFGSGGKPGSFEVPAGHMQAEARPAQPVTLASTPDGLLPQEEVDCILSEFKDVFEAKPGCPPYRFDLSHTIRLEPGAIPPFRRPYRLSLQEREEVEKQVRELLAKGLIEPCASPYGAPVLFVQKKDGTLRMCIDYRGLNKVTVRDRYPLPRIDELLDSLHGATVFSSLDLQSGYHQLRIRDEDKEKTAFVTHMGQFQYLVLPFGLTNAPATFQRVMNRVFAPYIGKFILVYIDDILVFSRTVAEHAKHLRIALQVLREHQLTCKLAKCELNRPQLKFLGHIVGRHGVSVDNEKIEVVRNWPIPRNLKELQ